MKKEKDEEFDNLFKKGMEDPVNEPVFRETDWDAMEQLLDQRKKRRGFIYWLPRLGSVAALLLLFLGWWLFKPQVVKHTDHQQVATIHSKPNTGTSGSTSRHETADSSKHKILDPANYAQNPDHPGAGKKTNRSFPYLPVGPAAKIPGKNPANRANVLAQARSNDKKPSADDKKNAGSVDANKANTNTLAASASLAPGKKDSSLLDANNTNGNALAVNTTSAPDKKDLGTADTNKTNGNTGNDLTKITPKGNTKAIGRPNGANRAIFAVSAIASSDMNGTSPVNSGRLGGNLGAIFSVRSGKWTFSTGAMYSIKPYEESFADYHTSNSFVTNPTTVGANCRMIDIPLNVNYQVYRQGVNRITLGTGLSSYIILREDYSFNYAYNYPGQQSGFSVVNRDRNLLSILNLDATYEHQVNSRFGVVFQPYYKLPLTNVGVSQVKLQSTGIAVGLNWNLNSFRKPN